MVTCKIDQVQIQAGLKMQETLFHWLYLTDVKC